MQNVKGSHACNSFPSLWGPDHVSPVLMECAVGNQALWDRDFPFPLTFGALHYDVHTLLGQEMGKEGLLSQAVPQRSQPGPWNRAVPNAEGCTFSTALRETL